MQTSIEYTPKTFKKDFRNLYNQFGKHIGYQARKDFSIKFYPRPFEPRDIKNPMLNSKGNPIKFIQRDKEGRTLVQHDKFYHQFTIGDYILPTQSNPLVKKVKELNKKRDTPESFHKELSEEQEARNLERQERLEDGKGTGILDKLMPIYSESQLEELKKQQLEQDLAFWNKSNHYQGGEAYKIKSKEEPSITSHSMVFLDMSNLKEDLSFEEATRELKQRRKGFSLKSNYPLTPDECFPGTNMGTIDIKLDKSYFPTDEEKKELNKQFFPPLEIKQPRQKGNKVVEAIKLIWKQLNTKI